MFEFREEKDALVVKKSAFGGYEVTYKNIFLHYMAAQTPAQAAYNSLEPISGRTGEQPIEIINKAEDPSIRKSVIEYAQKVLRDQEDQKTNQILTQQTYQEPTQESFSPSISKNEALEILTIKGEEIDEIVKNAQYTGQPVEQVQRIMTGLSNLILKVQAMTPQEFANSPISKALQEGNLGSLVGGLGTI